MGRLLLSLLLFPILIQSQNDSIIPKKGVIAVDKLNVVYRGFPNPLTIAVPNAKSFTATAPGLTKVSEGKYTLTPGSGLDITISLEIITNNEILIKEEHKLKIKNMKMWATIDSQNCERCILQLRKEDLKNAIISIYTEPESKLDVGEFCVEFSESEFIKVKGNKISSEAYQRIKELKIGTIFKINRIGYKEFLYGCVASPKSIIVM